MKKVRAMIDQRRYGSLGRLPGRPAGASLFPAYVEKLSRLGGKVLPFLMFVAAACSDAGPRVSDAAPDAGDMEPEDTEPGQESRDGGVVVRDAAQARFVTGWDTVAPNDDELVFITNDQATFSWHRYDLNGRRVLTKTHAFEGGYNGVIPNNVSSFGSLRIDPADGSSYVFGRTLHALRGFPNSSMVAGYIAKLDRSGEIAWTHYEAKGEAEDRGPEVLAVDELGSVYVFRGGALSVGRLSKLARDGTLLWSVSFDFTTRLRELFPAHDIRPLNTYLGRVRAAASAGGVSYVWINVKGQKFDNAFDMLWILNKVDRDGALVWSKAIMQRGSDGRVQDAAVISVAPSPDDSAIYALGTCVSKLDADGKLIWSKSLERYNSSLDSEGNGTGGDTGASRFGLIVPKENDALYVLAPLTASKSARAQLMRYDADGNVVWTGETTKAAVSELRHEPSRDELLYTVRTSPLELARVAAADGKVVATLPMK